MKKFPTIADCEGCGACCLHMGYPSYLRGDDGEEPEQAWVTMPDRLKVELLTFIDQYEAPKSGLDGVCVWYDPETHACKNHDHRPRVCRDFRVGGEGCQQWRRVYGIGQK